jgi:hypothetical protein
MVLFFHAPMRPVYMATWQSIVGRTWGSIQWFQQSLWCSLQQLVKDQVYEIECLLPFSSVTSFQYLTNISWSCTQEHRKAPGAPAPATQEEGPRPSLQPLAAPAQAIRMHYLFKPQDQKLQHLLKDHFSKPFQEHPKEQWLPFLLVVWCQILKISSWKMIHFLNLCYLYCLRTSTWIYRLL